MASKDVILAVCSALLHQQKFGIVGDCRVTLNQRDSFPAIEAEAAGKQLLQIQYLTNNVKFCITIARELSARHHDRTRVTTL